MERKTKFILLGILILIIIGVISLWFYAKDKQFGSLPLDLQITSMLQTLEIHEGRVSQEVRTSILVGGRPEIDTLNLQDVLPENINEDEVVFISADSCDDIIVSEKTLKAKKQFINVWMKGCGDASKENPKYYIVLGNTKENVIRKCNEIWGVESKTCAELGGEDICSGSEICSGEWLIGAVDTDRCCSSLCTITKECADIGGKICYENESCTEYQWVEKPNGDRTMCCIGECASKS